MRLFKSSDLKEMEEVASYLSAAVLVSQTCFITDKKKTALKLAIGNIEDWQSLFYVTDGAWSNIDVLEHLLQITGPANIYFSSWAISSEAIRRFQYWQEQGIVKETYAIFDQGIRNRKPEIFQEAVAAFKNIRFLKCHAKLLVVESEKFKITVLGSANMTANPRKETGIILKDPSLADHSINWMLEEFSNV
ncbi:MAG: hypothetical protein EOO89_09855 [Pedobacter sp.]|nr:MAG: hypothetical protein EOO89_09855 [Pedobacter sp.]